MEKYKFDKEITKIIKGIAILMLVAAHCFSEEGRLYGYKVDFGIISKEIVMYICNSMYICVPIFAFLSSFGLTRILKKQNISDGCFIKERIIKILAPFSFVAVICITITFLTKTANPYGDGLNFILNLLYDIFGLSYILQTPRIVGTWWYIGFALIIVILIPITKRLYEKYGFYIFFIYIPILLCQSSIPELIINNIMLIPTGVIFAETYTLEKIREKLKTTKKTDAIFKFLVMTTILIILNYLRNSRYSTVHVKQFLHVFNTIYYIYYLFEFIPGIPILNKILTYLGNHSANIFYVHTFFRALWLKDFTYSLGNAIYIFGFVLLVSLALSIVIDSIKKVIKYEKLINKLSVNIIGKEVY